MIPGMRDRIAQIRHGQVPNGYQMTRFGIVPSDWMTFRVGDCLERVERSVEVQADEFYTQIGIRSHGKGLFYKEQVAGVELGNKAVFWIVPDCFILNIVFAWEQAFGKTTQAEVGMIGSHRFPMYRPVKDRVDIDYLISFFLTKRGTDILEAASPGGAGRNKTLGQDRFLKSKIVLPPLPEQRKIAAILATQDKVIELKTKLLEESKRRKKALMQRLLAPMGEKRLEAASPRGEAASCRFSAEWQIVRLSDLFLPVNRKNAKNNKNILTISAQDGLVSQMEYYKHQYASADTSGYTLLKEGEFAYNKSRAGEFPYGAIKMLKKYEEGVVSPIYLCFAAKKGVCQDFWSYYFNGGMVNHGLYRIAQEGARNHGLLNIPTDEFFNLELRVPPIAVQRRIVAVLSTADREIDLMEKELNALELKKKALMQLLLTGIVRVGKAASCRLERAGNEAAGSRFSTRIAKV